MNIRQAKPEDEYGIRQMYLEFLQEVQQYGHDVPATGESVNQAWAKHFAKMTTGSGVLLLAEHGTILEGFIAYVQISPIAAVNHCVYVSRGWRRQGIASDLITAAKARCRQLGIERIFDMASLTNEAALKLMAKMGEEPIAYAYSLTP
jgi:GNAT superfamily N-acetyltransferase